MAGIETSASEIADQLGDCDDYGAFISADGSSAGSHTGLVVGIIILVLLLVGVIISFLWYKSAHENEGKGGIPTSAMLTNNARSAANQMYMASAGGGNAGARRSIKVVQKDKSGTVNSIYDVPMDESMLAGRLGVENGQYDGTYETVDAATYDANA